MMLLARPKSVRSLSLLIPQTFVPSVAPMVQFFVADFWSPVFPGDDGDESGGWEHCVFETDPEKSQFRMFTYESNKFLLSARRSGDDFYISQYFDFPEECVFLARRGW